MQLLAMADTHVPARARDLPGPLWDAVDRADVVVHAGDWVVPDLLDRLLARLAPRGVRLVAVHGNNDGDELRARLPEVAHVELAGLRLAVVHETGAAAGRERRCDTRFGPGSRQPVDVLVFGHSHIPWDTETASGLRLLNPGSPTDRRRQPHHTYLTATVTPAATPTAARATGAGGAALTDVRLHRLPPR